jgi:hypothetical protein
VAQYGLQSASGHREVVRFVLAPGDQPCTRRGVDTGDGVAARRTTQSDSGRLRTDELPT